MARVTCSVGNFQNLAIPGKIQISVGAHLDLRVTALRDQGRQPSNLQLEPHYLEQIRLHQLQQEAGFGLNEVRVLVPFGDGVHGNAIAAHFARDGSQILVDVTTLSLDAA